VASRLRWTVWNQLTLAHVLTYRLTRGRIGGSFRGIPLLLLNHVGRRSGRWRTTPLAYLPDGDDMVLVASKGGSHKHPAWFLNVAAMDETTVEVDGRSVPVSVKVATPAQRRRLWPKVVDLYAGYERYQERTDRQIPLVILSPIESPDRS
jgi:deazaflavin-dependent oxidoreductase (nitroreductase family)